MFFEALIPHIIIDQMKVIAQSMPFALQAIGGNIMTASPISDLNPVFMAARCTLTLAAAGGRMKQ